MNREKWVVKNISNSTISLGILNMPALRPNNQYDLLLFATKDAIGLNSTIKSRILSSIIEIYKYKDDILVTTVNASNATTALTSAEEDEL